MRGGADWSEKMGGGRIGRRRLGGVEDRSEEGEEDWAEKVGGGIGRKREGEIGRRGEGETCL